MMMVKHNNNHVPSNINDANENESIEDDVNSTENKRNYLTRNSFNMLYSSDQK